MTGIHEQARLAGIETSYADVWGAEKSVPEETLHLLLRALNISKAGPQDAQAGTRKSPCAQNKDILPPVRIMAAERAARMTVPGAKEWELAGEEPQQLAAGRAEQDVILLPPLKTGYYQLKVRLGDDEKLCTLLVPPERCWFPEELGRDTRIWGISAQLYALRSGRNWGVGDFGDLKTLAEKASLLQASLIGLNPVSALFPCNPRHYTPYTPSSRLCLNTQYIDVGAVEGFSTSEEAQRLWNDAAFQEDLQKARNARYVDYPAVAALKSRALEVVFKERGASPDPGFEQFRRAGGEALRAQAIFDALCEYFQAKNGAFTPWQSWPEPYRSFPSPAIERFERDNAERVLYFLWLQWLADLQLGRAQETALSRGMKIGLYRDLAVGMDKAGAEFWMNPGLFLSGATIGCPPDEYNLQGQNWGLPPLNPFALRTTGYALFRELLRANMRHARALRIDHAFGLCRLYVIPEGKQATEGAYLRYPFEEMLAVIKIESHRNRCLVIGEDLGTFPPNYKEGASEAGLFSYKLLYFERDEKGDFIAPDRYPRLSLATLSTHDLPTYQGWLRSADIEERAALNLYPDAKLQERDRESRPRDIKRLAEALMRETPEANEHEAPPCADVQNYLARSAAAIFMVQLEDVLELSVQANIPATTTERPNWRMKLPEPIEEIAEEGKALWRMAAGINQSRLRRILNPPRATYRLQFNKDFTFYDAARIAPYLAKLGISHVYASPYFSARPGSAHGYDITDHNVFNAELGGEKGFHAFLAALQAHGLGHILDFVPNHMGVGGSDNAWWLSVLEWGRQSPYAGYFDIDWSPRHPGQQPKLMVPFLGDHYGNVLSQGQLKLKYDDATGGISLWYGPHCFPVCPRDYKVVLPALGDAYDLREGEALKERIRNDNRLPHEIRHRLDAMQADTRQLHALLETQHYRLAYWCVAASDINYRRFFDIAELAGVRPEVPELFRVMHRTVLALIQAGKLQGLRIDHIDGLADPARYCADLREKIGQGAYLIVEKILAGQEALAESWPIEGTSGYDALNIIAGVLASKRGEKTIDRIYRRFTGIDDDFAAMVFKAKLLILDTTLSSELQALSFLAKRIADQNIYTRDYTLQALTQAIKDMIAFFPVYRTYVTARGASGTDRRTIGQVVAQSKKRSVLDELSVYDFVGGLLRFEDGEASGEAVAFMRKFQQLSGPVMAKGVEDTAFYRYNRLLSLNEVGGNPGHFGISVAAFHTIQAQRAKNAPHSMIATATHDTKRGEDMRMRLHILSEIPREWGRMLLRWSRLNRSRRLEIDASLAPSRNDEYFIYQTLLGSMPAALMETPQDKELAADYAARLCEYMVKALREAKVITSWSHPHEAYENAVLDFVRTILDSDKSSLFLDDFTREARRIAHGGIINSLAQLILKLTLPGVPDMYQGSERWDLNLVDPDNRRPVDYALRMQALESAKGSLPEYLECGHGGAVKQQLIYTLLRHRNHYPSLYAHGNYEPLAAKGRHGAHILAYSRTHETHRMVVIVPVTGFSLSGAEHWPTGDVWLDAALTLPGRFRNILQDAGVHAGTVKISELLADFPAAVLFSDAMQ